MRKKQQIGSQMSISISKAGSGYILCGTIADIAVMPLPFETVAEARAEAWRIYDFMQEDNSDRTDNT